MKLSLLGEFSDQPTGTKEGLNVSRMTPAIHTQETCVVDPGFVRYMQLGNSCLLV